MKAVTRRNFLGFAGAGVSAALLAACSGSQNVGQDSGSSVVNGTEAKAEPIDYMVFVNYQHKIPDGWEDKLDLVEEESLLYDEPVKVERKTYEAYKKLKEELAKEDVHVELDSCFRSLAEQQEIIDDFTKKYGAEYAKQIVAEPGTSEHHSGLAIDLFLVIDGKQVAENEDMMKHPEVWEKVHAKLADYGFILRFPSRKVIFTGCTYEPWHIRYLDDPTVAHEIMDNDSTFNQYLHMEPSYVTGCVVDYGTSDLYSDYAIDSTVDTILNEFANWNSQMTRFAYAGDDACGSEELVYLNELRETKEPDTEEFKEAIVMLTDFHSPSGDQAEGIALEPDTDYQNYAWHLGRKDADDSWHLMTWGYA